MSIWQIDVTIIVEALKRNPFICALATNSIFSLFLFSILLFLCPKIKKSIHYALGRCHLYRRNSHNIASKDILHFNWMFYIVIWIKHFTMNYINIAMRSAENLSVSTWSCCCPNKQNYVKSAKHFSVLLYFLLFFENSKNKKINIHYTHFNVL